jgi:hypothetical protein
MSLDQKRISAGRNALIPCYKHHQLSASPAGGSASSWNLARLARVAYTKLLSSLACRLVVIAASLAFLSAGIYGSLQIRQKFNPVLFLPADSYLRRWVETHDQAYPSNGWSAEIYTGRLDYNSLAGMEMLTSGLKALVDNRTHLRSMDPWWPPLKEYAINQKNYTTWQAFSTPTDFPMVLSDFLFSTAGSSYKYNFKLSGKLACGQPAPGILASKFTINYLIMDGPEEHIPARQAVEQLIAKAEVSDTAFSHVKIYAAWETDEIIGFEMWRNIGISMGCVMVVTLLLLADIAMSLCVFVSVVITLADLVGFLHFWNMTIDIVTCVNVVLAIGLCVDYTVHIGHAYLVATGDSIVRCKWFFF